MSAAESYSAPSVRDYRVEDEDFVYASWLNSYRGEFPYQPNELNAIYFRGQRSLIDELKDRSRVLVAVTDDLLIGWLMFEPGTVHYIYVKASFREIGVARLLLQSAAIDAHTMIYTHSTKLIRPWFRRKCQQAAFKPELLHGRKSHERTEGLNW